MLVFNQNNIKKYYLSPYINIYYRGSDILIYNYIKNVTVRIGLKDPKIIRYLKQGHSYNELREYVREVLLEKYPDDWISIAYQAGIIE